MTFAPAVTTVFVLGILWKRGTSQAAMATLYAGSIIGSLYFLLDLPGIGKWILSPAPVSPSFAGLITDPAYGIGVPFMLVGPVLVVVCAAIYIVTSVVVMYYNFLQEDAVIVDVFIWTSLIVTLVSAADYFLKLRRLINETPEPTISRT